MKRLIGAAWAAGLGVAFVAQGAGMQAAHAQPANAIEAHLAAAKAAAGFDFAGTLARICIAPQTAPGGGGAAPPPPGRAPGVTEPPDVVGQK
jgi:hypothetical protein